MADNIQNSGVYTLGQLEQLGHNLARRHGAIRPGKADVLLPRLRQNEGVLRSTYRLVTASIREGHKVTPAGEWLLDNFHVIEEQIRTAKSHLPRRYSHELPVIDDIEWKTKPRVFIIARELINHTDGRLDIAALRSIVTAYQEHAPLRLGEIWAFPIMLRLGLIDNLRQIAESIATGFIDRRSAKYWAEKISHASRHDPHHLITEIGDLARSDPRLSSMFVSEFARRIHNHCHSPSMPLSWMEQRLSDTGLTIEQQQYLASQEQAHDQMSMSNSINSLRFLNETDWRDFVEDMSGVEAILRKDPTGHYPRMNFPTRDTYRHVIEYAARHSAYNEHDAAKAALVMSENAAEKSKTSSSPMHIGEILLGQSRAEFMKTLRVSPPLRDRVRQVVQSFPLLYYIGSIFTITTLFVTAPFIFLYRPDGHLSITIMIIAALSIFPASHAAIATVNWLTTLLIKPRPWARMDLSEGVPDTARTIVVIPSMMSDTRTIQKLVGDLEIRYLGNIDKNILFALLTDFCDANQKTQSNDQELLEETERGIKYLNDKYRDADGQAPFYLLHRPRLWNQNEGVWMGYERKRGKLSALNEFLRGKSKENFSLVVGDLPKLANIRYVITLDADTTLPRDTAKELIATMIHPLNTPKFDQSRRVVKHGYAILQPRVTIHPRDTSSTLFARIFSDNFGIDPYTKAVSDVYQDLFGEGSFIGKGIYDLDAFQKSLEARFPENRVLSHDLIESGFARSGLVSDAQLIEEYPLTYACDAKRRHRWVRGDWQIGSWMLPIAPDHEGQTRLNPLSWVNRWKIFDNVRRSMTPAATVALLFCCWFLTPQMAAGVSFSALAYTLFPQFLRFLTPNDWFKYFISFTQASRDSIHALSRAVGISFLQLAFLPDEASLAVDAALTSIYRMTISKKKLLEWRPAGAPIQPSERDLGPYLKSMWFSVIAGSLAALTFVIRPNFDTALALPLGVAWIVAPFLAWSISQPTHLRPTNLSPERTIFLRTLARRTWSFFEDFSSLEDNWLPPDNFQEYPKAVIAHRTSPTNIGLTILSTLGAFDFGYLPVNELIRRINDTLTSMEKLDRFKGHFYNWYDTQSLQPLNPYYISTVDSGNLSGALLVLSHGLNEIAAGNLQSERLIQGLDDVLYIIDELNVETPVVGVGARDFIAEGRKILADLNPGNPAAITSENPRLEETLSALLILADDALSFDFRVEQLEIKNWLTRLKAQVTAHRSFLLTTTRESAPALRIQLHELASRAVQMTKQDYSFLYNESNRLLAIGYQVIDSRRDTAYYDLLASEARLASFLAIANGSVPQEHWFALGRQLGPSDTTSTLLSWSGSMFEYLMPILIMPTFEGTLLDHACRSCVSRQIKYGKDRNVPWGISESGYNVTDANDNYQYRAFGVPGLGFKRGLEEDLVIAPYATVMALMIDPQAACQNMETLRASGYLGKYGFYEAIDFTPSRIPPGEDRVVIQSFMAHHQGMSFLSLTRHLLGNPMQRRMEFDPAFKATELLLRERMPKVRATLPDVVIGTDMPYLPLTAGGTSRSIKDPNGDVPEAHLLGNGRYHVMVTSSGAGYSTWNNLAITRWREDRTKDAHGFFIYIRDKNSEKTWSVGYQPITEKAKDYEVVFSEGRAEIRRSDEGIETHTEIAVSPDDDAELRRVTIANHSKETRVLEVTTYAEIVLAPAGEDLAHPCFSNLFVESEIIGDQEGILCRRRSRVATQKNPWVFHTMIVHGGISANDGVETDRSSFVGRNRNSAAPLALDRPLTNSSGPVLDPIVSMRKKISIPAGESVIIDCALGVSDDREKAIEIMWRFREKQLADRVLELAWTHGHVLLLQLNCTPADAILFGKMAGALIYGGAALRCNPAIVKANTKPPSAFWSYGISGDVPIVLVRLQSIHGLKFLETLVKGHDYWRRKGLPVDLVIWNESMSSYRQELHDKIIEVVAMASSVSLMDKSGGLFLRRPDQMPDEDRVIFQAAARLILTDDAGSLDDQVNSTRNIRTKLPKDLRTPIIPKKFIAEGRHVQARADVTNNKLFAGNGLGSFSEDAKEYIIRVRPGKSTPMPWVNVIANSEFGTVVSESGSSYTWSENAREHRLTPWFNDPVSDPTGEAIYFRDEDTHAVWSPTPGPCQISSEYEVRHGFGYSSFKTTVKGLKSVMTTFVAPDSPVKFYKMKLTNDSPVSRKISLTAYVEITLGDSRTRTAPHIVTELDPTLGALFARNMFASEFHGRVAFLGATEDIKSFTCDRTEFIGRNSSIARPAALDRVGLSGRVGALYDPCLAMQVVCELAPGATKEVAFMIGAGQSLADARNFRRQFRSLGSVHNALTENHRKWAKLLGRINIETPDQSLNALGNGWLQYQTISSRFWGRTGFYQSGGAYGFRDQLQDSMAIVYCAPELTREHIIRCAGRQFIEGDVQHWWHPPSGKGVRTSISDDLLWLPFVAAHYIKITGDSGVLTEIAPYLRADSLDEGQESVYSQPSLSGENGDIYEHCVKALNYALKFGIHGLPLMGSGDWNDGMNLVGHQGKGESVWLGFFLISIMETFIPLAKMLGDKTFATHCEEQIAELRKNLDKNAWDGNWYLRAFFDDGAPLGSAKNLECRIDSLPQSWAVLSGSGQDNRRELAMESVYKHLVDHEGRLIRLFTPPFDQHQPCPGYISGYLPGVRENGGQYTHAAIWVIQAFAKMGDIDRALELLNLINPISHGTSPAQVARYKVEPYVVAADVYGAEPHRGQGGWTWYSGSSAWLYRVILEAILGFDLQGDQLYLSPKLPSKWDGFRMRYSYQDTLYKINVKRTKTMGAIQRTLLDGNAVTGAINLINDHDEHFIEIELL